MRNPRKLLAFGIVIAVALVAGFGCWYWQFAKNVDAMTKVTLPSFESGFGK